MGVGVGAGVDEAVGAGVGAGVDVGVGARLAGEQLEGRFTLDKAQIC